MKDSLPTSPPVVYNPFALQVYNKPGDARRQKMSSPRFKKDKEIIAEYESQVKGKGKCAFRPSVVLLRGGLVRHWLTLLHLKRPGCGSHVIKGKFFFFSFFKGPSLR